jgi:spore germination protein KC
LSSKKRLLSPIAFSLLLLLPLTGCWSRVEINNRVFVTGMYVDKAENGGVELTLAFPLPNRLTSGQSGGGSPKGDPYTSISKQGRNLAEAFEKIQSDLSKLVGWGNTHIIVVGKEYAEQGIVPILEFVTREPSFRLKTYIFMAPRKAKEVAEIKAILERFPQEIIRKYARGRITLDTTVKDCLIAQNFGGDMAIPILKIGKRTMKSEENPVVTWVGNDDIALFRNASLVKGSPHVDRLGVKWLKNRMLNSILTVSSPTDGKLMSFFVSRTETRIKPVWSTDFFTFRVKVNAQFMLISSDSLIDMSSAAEIKKVESVLEKDIRNLMEGAFNESKKLGADTYQLGEYLKIYYPSKWKIIKTDWEQEYKSKAKLEAIIDAKVRRIGAEKKTIGKQNDQTEGEPS